MDAMTAFERRLASWLEDTSPADVPTSVVDAALAAARTVRQRPRWLTWIWLARWPRSRPAPDGALGISVAWGSAWLRLAWLVLALAALIAVLGALMATGAIRLEAPPLQGRCPDGSSPDVPGPVDQPRPPEARWATWDVAEGRSILALAEDETGQTSTWRFDVCANTWHQVPTARSPANPSWDGVLVADADSARLVFLAPGAIWSFDSPTSRWQTLEAKPMEASRTAAYDPVTGLILVFGDGLLETFDVGLDAWHRPGVRGEPPPRATPLQTVALAYDRSADRFVLLVVERAPTGVTANTWVLDPRTWNWTAAPATDGVPDLGRVSREDLLVYDEANRQVLAFGVDSVAAFDTATLAWHSLAAGTLDGHWAAKAYDPLNARVVAFPMGGMAPTRVSGGFRWTGPGQPIAFEPASLTWTTLLDPAP